MAPSGGWCLSVFSVCADETEPTAQQRAVAIKSFLNKIHPRFWFDEIAKICGSGSRGELTTIWGRKLSVRRDFTNVYKSFAEGLRGERDFILRLRRDTTPSDVESG